MIAFLNGFVAVFVAVCAWAAIANASVLGSNDFGAGPWWRLAAVGATLVAAPLAGAWIGMEVVTRLRPIRAMDPRVKRAGMLAAAGVAAGVASAAGSSVVFAFAPEWMPEAAVTAGLSLMFSALAMLPFARRRVGHCIHCGYDLRGGALRARCPECGAVGSVV